ncbi:alpha-L-rhamnosidase [Harryflintia acetispora]|uniref:alpha-L-rhamnosidase n=1 Tax=Harryflintia acetispora TaxID=1849041 RepID=UPI001898E0D5|nr:alpha-L-rhamnosidase [Harryflintia acetispora]
MTSDKAAFLRCEYRENPIGIDAPSPRLSWQMESTRQGAMQSAYQIEVSTEETFGALCWDSGRVQSFETLGIPYGGAALSARTPYFWRVRLWNEENECSGWSQARFETGFLGSPWMSRWIGARDEEESCHYYRREFSVRGGLRAARLYITACGLYEAHINGRKVGRDHLTPGWTSYGDHLQYQSYDVTGLLHEGENALGAILGDGWYKGPYTWDKKRGLYGHKRALRCQVHLWYHDGREEIVSSDERWRYRRGPILSSQLYDGEIYDARLELPGWDKPGLSGAGWSPVRVLSPQVGELVSTLCAPVRAQRELRVQKILRTPNGDRVLDLGQNMVGWPRIRVRGRKGELVFLRLVETLGPDGNAYPYNLRSAKQELQYILKGEGVEIFEPHFTFSGFRYIQVVAWPGEPNEDSVLGVAAHSGMEQTIELRSGNPLIERLYKNILWGQRGNFVEVPLDCPQRDERFGWTGDAQIFARTASFNFDCFLFYEKWLRGVRADQFSNGAVPFVVPNILPRDWDLASAGPESTSAAWGDCVTICPWVLYTAYGDRRILEENYGAMKRYVGYMRAESPNGLWEGGSQLGDWVALDAKPGDYIGATDPLYTATAFYAVSTRIVAKVARLLGRQADAQEYEALYGAVRAAFRARFVRDGEVSEETQTAQVLALVFGLVEDGERPAAVRKLAELIERKGGHLDTGFVGAPYICFALSENGRADLAYELLFKEDFPSWLYQVRKGATTVWEHWDGIMEDGSFWSDEMNSFNHYSYGSIGEWIYRVAAGIDCDAEEAGGYRDIRLHPVPDRRLSELCCRYRTPRGTLESGWRMEGDKVEYQFTIPPNTTAILTLRAGEGARVSAPQNARSLGSSGGEARYLLAPGRYRFTVK